MKWKYIKWQLIFFAWSGNLRWAVISGSSDRKHERSTQARVMRIIAIIIIIAVDVGKAGELVIQLSWPCS